MERSSIIKELTRIPGVGKSIATDLYNIGIRRIEDLKGRDPERLYNESNRFAGCTQDRCLLYVFRCAVYFTDTPPHMREADKLKWWNWKNGK
ncbi:helix-hairpin-helix domain-containing protein [Niabella drilacis]|uniref:Pathogenicity locus n=1 Tax=Niabella drilacis (strain DSM 25811 / CCM 8410 / CCUG 62505 / LMG 26954 / E90) TaxID=1285928 RepID=A0A1G6LIS6_NIADE|nr:helix-hairpin-helix domain-containing protein [Niabella drilacis]SDC43180.1 Pathogenicity locus [Niabella drilacis]